MRVTALKALGDYYRLATVTEAEKELPELPIRFVGTGNDEPKPDEEEVSLAEGPRDDDLSY